MSTPTVIAISAAAVAACDRPSAGEVVVCTGSQLIRYDIVSTMAQVGPAVGLTASFSCVTLVDNNTAIAGSAFSATVNLVNLVSNTVSSIAADTCYSSVRHQQIAGNTTSQTGIMCSSIAGHIVSFTSSGAGVSSPPWLVGSKACCVVSTGAFGSGFIVATEKGLIIETDYAGAVNPIAGGRSFQLPVPDFISPLDTASELVVSMNFYQNILYVSTSLGRLFTISWFTKQIIKVEYNYDGGVLMSGTTISPFGIMAPAAAGAIAEKLPLLHCDFGLQPITYYDKYFTSVAAAQFVAVGGQGTVDTKHWAVPFGASTLEIHQLAFPRVDAVALLSINDAAQYDCEIILLQDPSPYTAIPKFMFSRFGQLPANTVSTTQLPGGVSGLSHLIIVRRKTGANSRYEVHRVTL